MVTPYYADEQVTLHHGDCLDVLPQLQAASVDAVVTDPPYGLEFMGRDWDGADGFRRSLNPEDVGRESVFGRTSRTSPEYRTDHAYQTWCRAWASDLGRWPPNVVLDEYAAAELDAQSGGLRARGNVAPTNGGGGMYGHAVTTVDHGAGDEGGASRFFPVFRYEAKAPASERPRVDGDAHETVKPLDLMRWLVRLVTPPGGLVCDPFAGSGTTAEACVIEGFRCVAIERAERYLPLIVARLSKPLQPVLSLDVTR